jgi:hypothetical protein
VRKKKSIPLFASLSHEGEKVRTEKRKMFSASLSHCQLAKIKLISNQRNQDNYQSANIKGFKFDSLHLVTLTGSHSLHFPYVNMLHYLLGYNYLIGRFIFLVNVFFPFVIAT